MSAGRAVRRLSRAGRRAARRWLRPRAGARDAGPAAPAVLPAVDAASAPAPAPLPDVSSRRPARGQGQPQRAAARSTETVTIKLIADARRRRT